MSKEAEVKSKRPPDDAFRQQKLPMFQPIMTPIKVIILFLAIGIAFVPAGVSMLQNSNNLFEKSFTYDNGLAGSTCYIKENNQKRVCDYTFKIDSDFSGPLYVYYQLTNFYQNHRRYVNSRDTYQLAGAERNENELKASCNPTYIADGSNSVLLNPCGLIANSYFSDVFFLESATNQAGQSKNMELDETGIAWESDKEKFKQPDGFWYDIINCGSKPSCLNDSTPCGLYNETISGTQTCYSFKYPSPENYKYLYQTYDTWVTNKDSNTHKSVISPVKGVTDEHFMVWMRTAALPTFRKLYGRIDGNFKKGDTVKFGIVANFVTESFSGTKSLVISNLNDLGGKNPYLGVSYIVVGSLSLLFGSLFALKNILSPRPIGSPRLLPWS